MTTINDLPADMVNRILNQLDEHDIQSVSLVSKYFRSLTYDFVRKLTFNPVPSTSEFRTLIARLPSVTRFVVHSNRASVTPDLAEIANSGFKVKSLELIWEFSNILGKPNFTNVTSLSGMFDEVKSLKLEWLREVEQFELIHIFYYPENSKIPPWSPIDKIKELQVVQFIHIFHSLQELDLSTYCVPFTDTGIEKLASNVPNLRKILLNSVSPLNNRSLDALSTCVNLEHFSWRGNKNVTVQSFCAFVRKRNNFKSLDVPLFFKSAMQEECNILAETLSSCESLSHLSFGNDFVRDEVLSVIARSRSSITSLEFKENSDQIYTMSGLSALLGAFQGLTKLRIYLPQLGPDSKDTQMSQLVESLPNLKDVMITSIDGYYATLFSLINNCPLLESIYLECLNSGTVSDATQQIKNNYSVRRIILNPEPVSTVKIALKFSCPFLKILKYG